jgi:hypothetical protein
MGENNTNLASEIVCFQIWVDPFLDLSNSTRTKFSLDIHIRSNYGFYPRSDDTFTIGYKGGMQAHPDARGIPREHLNQVRSSLMISGQPSLTGPKPSFGSAHGWF